MRKRLKAVLSPVRFVLASVVARNPWRVYSVLAVGGGMSLVLRSRGAATDLFYDIGVGMVGSVVTVALYEFVMTSGQALRARRELGLADGAAVLGLTGVHAHDLPVAAVTRLLEGDLAARVEISVQFDPDLWTLRDGREPGGLLGPLERWLSVDDGRRRSAVVLMPDPESEAVRQAIRQVWTTGTEASEVQRRMSALADRLDALDAVGHSVIVRRLPRLPNFTCYRIRGRNAADSLGFVRFYAQQMTIDDHLPVLEFAYSSKRGSLWRHTAREFAPFQG